MTKIHDGPTIGYSTPAMAGPITRLRFTCVELSEMAPGRSVRPTRLGSTALHAGRLRALPMPMANTQANRAQRDGSSPDPDDGRQDQREDRLLELEDDQEQPAVEQVGEEPAEQPEEQQRARAGRR